ncbi:MAG TPA: YdcF family protein [Pseudobdellovibrionaceae bacterium]|nr:YdcF family protein [Pseudobdellovibrionaceae bacterium]
MREIMPNILFYGGLREKDISLERKSGSTYGNAQQSLPIAEALECRDVLLVTSRYHMHRAYNTFRSIFPDHIIIYKNSVYGNLNNNKFIEILVEALKTRFYKLWVF